MAASTVNIAGAVFALRPPNASLLADVVAPSGRHWRLYVGSGGDAAVCRASGRVGGHAVTHVLNCAAAEEPFCYFNSRPGTLYANLVTRDHPHPAPEAQRPDFAPLAALLAASLSPGAGDVCLLVHCVYGANRSCVAAALVLRLAAPAAFASVDAALAHVGARHAPCAVHPEYRAWATAFAEAPPAGWATPLAGLTAVLAPPAVPPQPGGGGGGGGGGGRSSGAGAAAVGGSGGAPAAAPGGAQGAGAGVIATHDYHDASGRATCLAAFFILEQPYQEEGLAYCFPLEGAKPGEAPPATGARALFEELHLHGVRAADLADAARFRLVALPGTNLFVALQPGGAGHCGGEAGTLSRATFLARRQEIAAARAAGATHWHGASIWDHLETHACVHVDVASLLVGAHGEWRPRDHRGAALEYRLRGVAASSLRAPAVQAALREALANFYARHPALAPLY